MNKTIAFLMLTLLISSVSSLMHGDQFQGLFDHEGVDNDVVISVGTYNALVQDEGEVGLKINVNFNLSKYVERDSGPISEFDGSIRGSLYLKLRRENIGMTRHQVHPLIVEIIRQQY